MRSSRSVVLVLIASVSSGALAGCGGLSDEDRTEIRQVVRTAVLAQARGDGTAYCRVLTRELRNAYASQTGTDDAGASRCAKAFERDFATTRRLQDARTPDPDNAGNNAAMLDAFRRVKGRDADLARAVRNPSNIAVQDDDQVLVIVTGRRFRDRLVVAEDDGTWRIAPGPETATLR